MKIYHLNYEIPNGTPIPEYGIIIYLSETSLIIEDRINKKTKVFVKVGD